MKAGPRMLALAAIGALLAISHRSWGRARRMTLGEIRELARAVGFPDPDLAAAVAMEESRGNPHAENVTERERSIGLWQVNVRAHPQYSPSRLRDPAYNARAAFEISRGGTDWSHWTAYTSGRYRAWMPGGSS